LLVFSSQQATQEKVVPRSIPMIGSAMVDLLDCVLLDDDGY
jgi:hypothetical protein